MNGQKDITIPIETDTELEIKSQEREDDEPRETMLA